MPAVKINLTTEQLVTAFTQLDRRERRAFMEAVLTEPTHQQLAVELLAEIKAVLRRKFPPSKQALLDKLLDANIARELRPTERKELDELISGYGKDLVDKARLALRARSFWVASGIHPPE